MKGLIATVIIMALLTSTGIVYASQSSLPGDALHAVKTSTESLRLMSSNDAKDAELWLEFAGKRLDEMVALAEKDRTDDIKTAAKLYSTSLDNAFTSIERADNNGVDVGNLLKMVSGISSAHVKTLVTIHEIVPLQAQRDIENGIRGAISGYYTAVRELIDRRQLFDNQENLVTISMDDIAENPALSALYERKSIRIATDLSTRTTGTDLTQSIQSQNFIAQLLDPLVGYALYEFKRVETVQIGFQSPVVTFRVTASSDYILIELDSED